ncbi:MAG: hypothetical protein KJ046_17705, partial [Anaerolineae bacterium]|nr:hypothetical protein [Anaerolineae bacterium]
RRTVISAMILLTFIAGLFIASRSATADPPIPQPTMTAPAAYPGPDPYPGPNPYPGPYPAPYPGPAFLPAVLYP